MSLLLSRMSGRKWVRQLWDEFLSLGASVSKEGRSGPVRAVYLRSELTPGDVGGPKSHVFGSVLGGFKVTIGSFMLHVENSSSWGGWGVA